MAGASPDDMASSVAEPLERHLGQIANVTEMTSQSSVGQTRIILQFGLDRDINGAARDVEAAINAARADLPSSLRSNPTYNKVNPADSPIMIVALTSETQTQGQLYDSASTVLEQRLSQITGIGEVDVSGSALPAVRVELNPGPLVKYGIGLEDVRAALASANANSPKGAIEDGPLHYQIYTNDQASKADQYKPLVVAYRDARSGEAVRRSGRAGLGRGFAQCRVCQWQAVGSGYPLSPAWGQHHRRRRFGTGGAAAIAGGAARRHQRVGGDGPQQDDPLLAGRHAADPDHLDGSGDPGGPAVPARRPRHDDPKCRRARLDRRHVRGDVPAGLQPGQFCR